MRRSRSTTRRRRLASSCSELAGPPRPEAWELPPTTDRGGRGETIERRGERPRRSGARPSDGARRDRRGESACCSCGAGGTRERRCDDSACRSRGRETAGAAAPANWACRARQTPVNCCICPRSSATSRAVAGATAGGAGTSWFAPAAATASSPGGDRRRESPRDWRDLVALLPMFWYEDRPRAMAASIPTDGAKCGGVILFGPEPNGPPLE